MKRPSESSLKKLPPWHGVGYGAWITRSLCRFLESRPEGSVDPRILTALEDVARLARDSAASGERGGSFAEVYDETAELEAAFEKSHGSTPTELIPYVDAALAVAGASLEAMRLANVDSDKERPTFSGAEALASAIRKVDLLLESDDFDKSSLWRDFDNLTLARTEGRLGDLLGEGFFDSPDNWYVG